MACKEIDVMRQQVCSRLRANVDHWQYDLQSRYGDPRVYEAERTEQLKQEARVKTAQKRKSFSSSADRPVRSSPTVPPRPVPWLPMAMADLTRAVGIASRRARARASLSPPPAGDVGKRKQLRRLYPGIGVFAHLASV